MKFDVFFTRKNVFMRVFLLNYLHKCLQRSVFRLSDNNHSRANGVPPPAKMNNKCKQRRLLTRSSEWFCIKMFFCNRYKTGSCSGKRDGENE